MSSRSPEQKATPDLMTKNVHSGFFCLTSWAVMIMCFGSEKDEITFKMTYPWPRGFLQIGERSFSLDCECQQMSP